MSSNNVCPFFMHQTSRYFDAMQYYERKSFWQLLIWRLKSVVEFLWIIFVHTVKSGGRSWKKLKETTYIYYCLSFLYSAQLRMFNNRDQGLDFLKMMENISVNHLLKPRSRKCLTACCLECCWISERQWGIPTDGESCIYSDSRHHTLVLILEVGLICSW